MAATGRFWTGGFAAVLLLAFAGGRPVGAQQAPAGVPAPQPLEPAAVVIPLWRPDELQVKGDGGPEIVVMTPDRPGRVQSVANIHNPSLELYLAPADKRPTAGVILAAGGGNRTVNVGTEGTDVAHWLNSLGVSAFVLRYRIQPYDSAVEGLADTQRAVRMVRARSSEWGVDPAKIGVMGFSAGGEQAARATLRFDRGEAASSDFVARHSCRPDFTVMVYPGWRQLDMTRAPADAPPTFITSAGIDDAFHARQSVEFYSALFGANVPVELHIYGHGGHAGGIGPRGGIPFGAWPQRFVEWARDLGMLPRE